jgi:UDP-N-acetylglucosamine 2-epimerase
LSRAVHDVLLTLGIRPDLIRGSRIIHLLSEHPEIRLTICWSGQHYADNLKDVFIRDLDLPAPDIELGASGEGDAGVAASVIARLSPVLRELAPEHRHGLHRGGAAQHPDRSYRGLHALL